jgi:hypothetical protein
MTVKFPETANRFIAYFDIMGFKDLIYRTDHSTVSDLMRRMSDAVAMLKQWEDGHLKKNTRGRKKETEKGIVLPVLFSDSVLFVSRADTVFDARKTVFVTSVFLRNVFSHSIPVKGALAYGMFTADFATSKFFGRPLVDAYLLAEETDFYGAVLHHSFEKYLHDLGEELPETILKRKRVPMKGGLVTHSFIDWRFHPGNGEGLIEYSLESFYRSVSGNARRYVDNTRLVYEG